MAWNWGLFYTSLFFFAIASVNGIEPLQGTEYSAHTRGGHAEVRRHHLLGDPASYGRHILLQGHVLNTESVPSLSLNDPKYSLPLRRELLQRDPEYIGMFHLLVHVQDVIDNSAKDAIERYIDHPLNGYMPHNTFMLTTANASVVHLVNTAPGVLWVGEVQAHHKHPPNLFDHPKWSANASLSGSVHQLHVHLPPSRIPMAQVASDAISCWNEYLTKHYGSRHGVSISEQSDSILQIDIPLELSLERRHQFVSYLLAHPLTYWMENAPTFKLYSTHAQHIIQNGEDSDDEVVNATANHMTARGLTGQNLVVGLADTSLDLNSCFFSDPGKEVPSGLDLNAHRKFVSYNKSVFEDDAMIGDSMLHGTHTAGVIVGEALDSSSPVARYNGMIPNARLAYAQIAEKSLALNPEKVTSLYEAVRNASPPVYCNAWGFTWAGPQHESLTDQYAYDNQDMLLVFPAGNAANSDRTASHYSHYTIVSPGSAKNVLTVGASMNSYKVTSQYVYSYSGPYLYLDADFFSVVEIRQGLLGPEFKDLDDVPLSTTPNSEGGDSWTSRLKIHFACEDIDDNSIRGTIFIVQRGHCKFSLKASVAQRAGAIAVLVVDHDNLLTLIGDSNPVNVTIPMGMIRHSAGIALLDKLDKGVVRASITNGHTISPEQAWYDWHTVVSWSSRGPTFDGRIKPDVVAPGWAVMSAEAGSECSVVARKGTSISTALVSGAAILVTEYFQKGYYPMGGPRVSGENGILGVPPGAAMLKALLINSAKSMYGTIALRGGMLSALDDHPDKRFLEGHGLVNLKRSFPFADDPTPLRLFVRTAKLRSLQYAAYQMNVSRDPAINFSATIAWMDPVGVPHSGRSLVNDIDLIVIGPTHEPIKDWNGISSDLIHVGNHFSIPSEEGVNCKIFDTRNNVEKIELPGESGIYTVIVRGYQVPVNAPQSVALAVNYPGREFDNPQMGPIEVPDEIVGCPFGCGFGICSQFRCKCPMGSVGPQCATKIHDLSGSAQSRHNVVPGQWKYFRISVPRINSLQRLSITSVTEGEGLVAYYLGHNAIPTETEHTLMRLGCYGCHTIRNESTVDITYVDSCFGNPDSPCPIEGGNYFLGLLSSADGNITVSLRAEVISCSAACNSVQAAPRKRYGIPICGCDKVVDAIALRGELAEMNETFIGHWHLVHTIPCRNMNCTQECIREAGMHIEGLYGVCNIHQDQAMCECMAGIRIATDSTSNPRNSTYSRLVDRCSHTMGFTDAFKGEFAAMGCNPEVNPEQYSSIPLVLGSWICLVVIICSIAYCRWLYRHVRSRSRPGTTSVTQSPESRLEAEGRSPVEETSNADQDEDHNGAEEVQNTNGNMDYHERDDVQLVP